MTFPELFKLIEEEEERSIVTFTLNFWIDNVFKGTGQIQEPKIQELLRQYSRTHVVLCFRVFKNDIFIIAKSNVFITNEWRLKGGEQE